MNSSIITSPENQEQERFADINLKIDEIENSVKNHISAIQNCSYESGLLGMSLFYAFKAKFKNDDTYYKELAEQYLMDGLNYVSPDQFVRIYKSDSYDNHLGNIGRLLLYYSKYALLDFDADDYLMSLEKIMEPLLLSKITIADFDYNSGALATGMYFLQRYRLTRNEKHREILAKLVTGIHDAAQEDEYGNFYWPSPSLWQKVYFGLSHGSAMLVSFLADLCELDIHPELAKKTISKAVGFILKHKRPDEFGEFPIHIGDETGKKQISVCYGDLGVGYALLKASVCTVDPDLKQLALRIISGCASYQKEDNLTWDASLIYGAGGLAAFFKKLFLLTEEKACAKASTYWYDQIGTYATFENEYAGFKTLIHQDNDLYNICFGWGIIGVGISLMKSADTHLPDINELLMIG
jgi:lantibiotic modifying enzyme